MSPSARAASRRLPGPEGAALPSPPGGRGTVLPRVFYDRPTLEVARDLIGMVLVHVTPAGAAAGRIVEAEAYIGEDDPACHAAPGPTRRNGPLYGAPGCAYVYLNYGIHYLVNAVTERQGTPAAVLLRALEPLEGIDLMRRRRVRGTGRPAASIPEADLCRGPGNLSRALGISLRQNRTDLGGPRLYIEDRGLRPAALCWSPRIGIRVGTDRAWRCVDARSRALSGARILLRDRDLHRQRAPLADDVQLGGGADRGV